MFTVCHPCFHLHIFRRVKYLSHIGAVEINYILIDQIEMLHVIIVLMHLVPIW